MTEGKLPEIDTTLNPGVLAARLKEYGTKGKLTNLQKVLEYIKHPVEIVKNAATSAACTLIRENLINYYHEISHEVRGKLGSLLESLDPSIIDELSKDLYSDSDERRVRSIQILGLLRKNPRIKNILVNLIKDKDPKIRATAVSLLGKIIGPNDQEIIMALLNDTDKRVRANTIEALESLGNKRIIPILLRYRKDNNNRVRGNILKALYNLGVTDIEEDLLEMLSIPSDLMKASALWVISQINIKSRNLEDAAGLALMSENEMVCRNAKNALQKMGTPRAMGYLRYFDLRVC